MTLGDILRQVLADQQLVYLAVLIGAALLAGVAAALATSTFRLANLADFVERQLIPIALGYVVAALLAYGNPTLEPFKVLVFGALAARLVASITMSLAAMGLPLPPVLSERIVRPPPVIPVAPASAVAVSAAPAARPNPADVPVVAVPPSSLPKVP